MVSPGLVIAITRRIPIAKKKKADRTKALLQLFAIVAVPLVLLLLLVGAAAGAAVGLLAIATIGVIVAALVLFSVIRRRGEK